MQPLHVCDIYVYVEGGEGGADGFAEYCIHLSTIWAKPHGAFMREYFLEVVYEGLTNQHCCPIFTHLQDFSNVEKFETDGLFGSPRSMLLAGEPSVLRQAVFPPGLLCILDYLGT